MRKLYEWSPVVLSLVAQGMFIQQYMMAGFILSGLGNIVWILTTQDRRMIVINIIFGLINLVGIARLCAISGGM